MTNEIIYHYINIHELAHSLKDSDYYKSGSLNFTHCRIAGYYSKNYLQDLVTKSKVKISINKESNDGFMICYGKWEGEELLVAFYSLVDERDVGVFYKEIDMIKDHLKNSKLRNISFKSRQQKDIEPPFTFSDEKEELIKIQAPIMSQIQVAVNVREFNNLSDFDGTIPSLTKPIIPSSLTISSIEAQNSKLQKDKDLLSEKSLTSDIHSAKNDGDLFDDHNEIDYTQVQKKNQAIIEGLLSQNPNGLSVHELATSKPGLKLAEVEEAVDIMKAGYSVFEVKNKLFLLYKLMFIMNSP